MSYNAANVDDLTRPRPDLPDPHIHRYDRHARLGAASVGRRAGHLQAAHRPGRPRLRRLDVDAQRRHAARPLPEHRQCRWDLRGNIACAEVGRRRAAGAERRAAAAGRGANANLPQFSAYADKIEQFIHIGAAESYRERAMYTAIYGSVANCVAAGGTRVVVQQQHAAHDPREPERERAHQGLPDADLGASRHGVPAPGDGRRRQLPDRARRPPDRRHSNPAFPNGFPDTLYYEDEGSAR